MSLLRVESDRVRRRLFEREQFSLDEAVATCRAMAAASDDLKTKRLKIKRRQFTLSRLHFFGRYRLSG